MNDIAQEHQFLPFAFQGIERMAGGMTWACDRCDTREELTSIREGFDLPRFQVRADLLRGKLVNILQTFGRLILVFFRHPEVQLGLADVNSGVRKDHSIALHEATSMVG